MKKETITKSIEINAPKEKVWNILLDDKFTRIWYSEFSEGSYVETDWKVGSKALFKDGSGHGLVSKVIDNKRNEVISIEHQAVIINGKENYESEEAKKWNGCKETYRLTGKNGNAVVTIEQEMPEDYLKSFLLMWDKALRKIKELSESK